MTSVFTLATLSFLFAFCSAQIAPQWGTIECDSTLTDRFPPGADYDNYYRYYTLTTVYSTRLRRDVRISTCIEERDDTIAVEMYPNTWYSQLHLASDPYNSGSRKQSSSSSSCDADEHGVSFTWTDLPEGDWEIGILSEDSNGGRYKLSVECLDISTPSPPLADPNATKYFDEYNAWQSKGSQKISCDVSAYGTLTPTGDPDGSGVDYYQYEVTSYAQEIVFTTCDPDTFYDSPTFYQGSNPSYHTLRVYYWDFGDLTGWTRNWYSRSDADSSCTTVTIPDTDTESYQKVRASPGIYYVGVESSNTGVHVLSMLCWNNAAVKSVTANQDYTVATYLPTLSPVTGNPTTAEPTSDTTTPAPTEYPTETFGGHFDNIRKQHDEGDIACGIYRHGTLQRKHMNSYTFDVLATMSYVAFDTCMDDQTKWDACVSLHRLVNGNWQQYDEECGYCNLLDYQNLPAGEYRVEIYGDGGQNNRQDNYGDYILRMGCDLDQYDYVPQVLVTNAPTPAPVGVAPINARDGDVVGDISCDLTVSGTTSSQNGDFHKFTINSGGIDWVKFDTCTETEFANYLFVYDYYNHTGHEFFDPFWSSTSLGFHAEGDTVCNELTMWDLTPGVYYVNIDGYNYYFDHGFYTLTMTCSDNSQVAGANNYEAYKPGLPGWAWALVIIGIIVLVVIIVIAVCCCMKKKKGESGSGGSGGKGESSEMGRVKSADAAED